MSFDTNANRRKGGSLVVFEETEAGVRVPGRSGLAPDTAGNQEIGRLYFLDA